MISFREKSQTFGKQMRKEKAKETEILSKGMRDTEKKKQMEIAKLKDTLAPN